MKCQHYKPLPRERSQNFSKLECKCILRLAAEKYDILFQTTETKTSYAIIKLMWAQITHKLNLECESDRTPKQVRKKIVNLRSELKAKAMNRNKLHVTGDIYDDPKFSGAEFFISKMTNDSISGNSEIEDQIPIKAKKRLESSFLSLSKPVTPLVRIIKTRPSSQKVENPHNISDLKQQLNIIQKTSQSIENMTKLNQKNMNEMLEQNKKYLEEMSRYNKKQTEIMAVLTSATKKQAAAFERIAEAMD